MQIFRHQPGLSIRLHQDQAGRARRLPGSKVKAKVANVGAPLGVQHHVVAMKRRQRRQISHLCQNVAIKPQQTPIRHRHQQQFPIGQPTQTGRLTRHRHHGFTTTRHVHPLHAMSVKVREP